MAYLICRAPSLVSRASSVPSLSSACLSNSKPLIPLIRHAFSTASEPPLNQTFIPQRIDRSGEPPDITRARLLYQSRKRGILETDLLLSTFAQKYLSSMSMTEMKEYDKLLDEPDWDIYYWATERKPAPGKWKDSQILELLKEHVKNEDKVIFRMPDLAG